MANVDYFECTRIWTSSRNPNFVSFVTQLNKYDFHKVHPSIPIHFYVTLSDQSYLVGPLGQNTDDNQFGEHVSRLYISLVFTSLI